MWVIKIRINWSKVFISRPKTKIRKIVYKIIGDISNVTKERTPYHSGNCWVFILSGREGEIKLAVYAVSEYAKFQLQGLPYYEQIGGAMELVLNTKKKLIFEGTCQLRTFANSSQSIHFDITKDKLIFSVYLDDESSKNLQKQGIGERELQGGTCEIVFYD